jgi:hypothetical protein
MSKMQRYMKHTENSSFSGIVETENKNSSFFVTENRWKQSCKH